MKILAIDTIHSSTMLAQMSVDTCSPNLEVPTVIKCRLSDMLISDLEDPDLYIRVRYGIMKDVPRRKHKKHRIQKKWIKRYGMKQIVDYQKMRYKVQHMELNFAEDTVEFSCIPDEQLKKFTMEF